MGKLSGQNQYGHSKWGIRLPPYWKRATLNSLASVITQRKKRKRTQREKGTMIDVGKCGLHMYSSFRFKAKDSLIMKPIESATYHALEALELDGVA